MSVVPVKARRGQWMPQNWSDGLALMWVLATELVSSAIAACTLNC